MNIQQAERPLEQYVEKFLSVVHLVSWSNAMINTCFQMGLNDDKLFCSITPDDCRKPVAEFINYVLALCNSNFYVDVEDSNLPPICKHATAPARHQPASSTCCSNELTPSGPPSLTTVLQSSSLILSPEPGLRPTGSQTPAAASSRTPATALRSSKPATVPRSGLTADIMASHLCHMDTMDQFGILSPSFLLVPSSPPSSLLVLSSPPKSPLVLSSPPESERPPEPAPPERPPVPAPPERPPEPAPPKRPPEPAPPERPPVPAPPKPGPPVHSWAANTLISPKKIFWGGYPPDPPWPSGLYTWPWLPDLPDPTWSHGLFTPLWLPELPDPPWVPGLYPPLWLPELPDPPWHPGLYATPWLPELPDPPWRRTSSPSC
ncbi:hypothetical protein M9458_032564, partial [Cirrhinus mrigala]